MQPNPPSSDDAEAVRRAGRRYRAFICYSRADAAFAAWLHRRLEAYRMPRDRREAEKMGTKTALAIGPIFRDSDELEAAAHIGERLRAALARSDFLIVLCSPAAARSRWVDEEIRAFRELRADNEGRVLAVIVRGDPMRANPGDECFPAALRDGAAASGLLTARVPLAADFRRGRESHRDAEIRLIAALLGVPFDALKRREQRRSVARLRVGVAAVSAVAAIFAGVALLAVRERQAAERAAQRATLARAEAEKLVDFMLGELRPKLEVIGKLELLEPANAKVRDYYRSIAPDESDLAVLRRRASAFRGQAIDLRNHRKSEPTLTALRAEQALRERIVALAPGDAAGWSALGESHRMLALQRRDDGRLDEALTELAHAKRHTVKAIPLERDGLQAAARLASLGMEEGEVLIRAGKSGAARPVLEKSWLELQDLAARDATRLETKNRAAAAAWQLGNVCRRAGDFSAAEKVYREGVELARQLRAAEPDNVFYLRRIELALGTLGQMLLEAGRGEEAVTTLRENLANSRAIVALDPANRIYQDGLATQLSNLGQSLGLLQRHDAALEAKREALQLREAGAQGSDDVRSRNVLALALAEVAATECELARPEVAEPMGRRAVAMMQELCRAASGDVRLADDLSYARSKLALAFSKAGRWADAEAEYRVTLAEIEAVISRNDSDPQLPRWNDRALYMLGIATAKSRQGARAEALSVAREALAEFERLNGAGLPEAVNAAAMREARELLASIEDRR